MHPWPDPETPTRFGSVSQRQRALLEAEHAPVRQVRTYTHSALLEGSLADRFGSFPLRTATAEAAARLPASHRARYWRMRGGGEQHYYHYYY